MASKKHWIVFGAWDDPDKSLVAYKDKKAGMWAVKVMHLGDEGDQGRGKLTRPPIDRLLSDEAREYTTIYFANKHGKESIDAWINILEYVKENWDNEIQGAEDW